MKRICIKKKESKICYKTIVGLVRFKSCYNKKIKKSAIVLESYNKFLIYKSNQAQLLYEFGKKQIYKSQKENINFKDTGFVKNKKTMIDFCLKITNFNDKKR